LIDPIRPGRRGLEVARFDLTTTAISSPALPAIMATARLKRKLDSNDLAPASNPLESFCQVRSLCGARVRVPEED